MQEIKVGDKLTIKVEVRKIIEDKTGKHYDVFPEGCESFSNTMIVEPQHIIE